MHNWLNQTLLNRLVANFQLEIVLLPCLKNGFSSSTFWVVAFWDNCIMHNFSRVWYLSFRDNTSTMNWWKKEKMKSFFRASANLSKADILSVLLKKLYSILKQVIHKPTCSASCIYFRIWFLLYLVWLKIKFCLFVLYLPTHFLPPYPKNYIAFSGGKIIIFFCSQKGW